MPDRPLLLSQAHVTEAEELAVARAVASGWVAPLGPDVDGFESDVTDFTGIGNALALSSGTAALHLGLMGLDVRPGDEVIVPTLTFGATAFAVTYVGATPVFVDAEPEAWGLDADLLRSILDERARLGRQVAAIVSVDLFGRPADYERILPVAAQHGVPVLVDAAESLGATHRGRAAGTMGDAGIYSFNGNKIITTSGGGMLVSDNEELIAKARFRSTQSRSPFPWYEHEEIGFNYRLSNVLAALGRVQLARLPELMARKRAIWSLYEAHFTDIDGLVVTPDPPWGTGNSWLTTLTFDDKIHPSASARVRGALASQNIEARPIWKPMHLQPVFSANEAHLTGTAEELFARGLCLPSGAGLTDDDIERVAHAVREAL